VAKINFGGAGTPDDLDQDHHTQAWLAASDDEAARVNGRNFHHKRERARCGSSRRKQTG
jgi:hypothetical protein